MRSKFTYSFCVILVTSFEVQTTRSEPTQCEVSMLTPDNAGGYGRDVDVSGDLMVVGVVTVGPPPGNGHVYVYRREGSQWLEDAILVPPVGTTTDYFGVSVAIDGNRVVVGCDDCYAYTPQPVSYAGKVFVFQRDADGWHLEAELQDSSPHQADRFGGSVDISNDRIVVGVQLDNTPDFSSGSVHVFRREGSGWIHEDQLYSPNPKAGARFGTAVAIHGERIIASAPYEHVFPGIFNAGAAHVFRWTGADWVHEARLVSPPPLWQGFGASVALDDERAVVGDPLVPNPQVGGRAQVFRRSDSTWSHEQALPNLDPDSEFGQALALRGDSIAVGARAQNSSQVAAYLYRFVGGEWLLASRLAPAENVSPPLDWIAAAVDGNTLVMTNRDHAAYVFDWEVAHEGPCPLGDVMFIDPPDGVVDARQPFGLSSAVPLQGIRKIEVAAPLGASQSCWSACNSVDKSNLIQRVEHACNGRYVITLWESMSAGSVTVISYLDDQGFATTGTFTSHPANANADGAANSLDILSLINYLNGVEQSPFGLYSTDINHSGVDNPADILRLIDLLNGADALDVWNETPRPAIVCP